MRNSQITMLAALGVVLAGVVFLVGAVRLTLIGDASAEGRLAVELGSLSPDLTGFDRIVVNDSWEIELVRGDDWRVDLMYPEDREDDLEVGVRDDQLVLSVADGPGRGWPWWGGGRDRFRAEITMPMLTGVLIDGAANVEMEDFIGGDLEIRISGFGNVEGRGGRFDSVNVDIAGAGNVALDFPVTDARVSLSGAGNIDLVMDGGVLGGQLSGFGNVMYSGTVREENVNVSGFGHVEEH